MCVSGSAGAGYSIALHLIPRPTVVPTYIKLYACMCTILRETIVSFVPIV